ncbi:MAG: SGNH/GDSL hydrolase family protein [Defluviitaleaceae bacterium]|nr:SGNH/GDSL hydrolase family protein [Defluviitaleaceae bacterium]
MRLTIVKITVAVLSFMLLFFGLQQLLMPKYATQTLEGNLIREYYGSGFGHDVIFLGDCEVYHNFSPITLWEEYGITSFIRGTPQQLIWKSYYLFEDVLRFETPRVVVYNVLSMQYNEPQSRYYNRLTLDGMRWGMPKLRAISASMTDGEDWLSYFLPLFRFKDRWREIGMEDFRYFFRRPLVSLNGFMIRTEVMPAGWQPMIPPQGDYRFGDKAYEYLEKMARLAADHGIELVLVKAPTLFPPWPDQWDAQITDFAEKHGLLYINFLNYIDEIGLDYDYHTFSAGLDLNVFGAELLARYFGGILQNDLGLPDRRGEAATAERWDELAALYRHTIARQLDELERYKRIQNFHIEW